jgi:hypothetical protein
VDRELHLTVDRFGRVHTPITSLAKELRPCLSVAGESLVGLDLRNSQPLIAGICARQFYRSKDARQRMLQRTFDNDHDPYRYREGMTETEPRRLSVERYIALCEDGLFYESMMGDSDDRDRLKERLYQEVFFGKNSYRSQVKDRFEAKFVGVAKMLHQMKRKDYRRSAWLLQNCEAIIFIDSIANRLRQERPGLVLFTIHDSFLTVPSEVEYVRSVILDEFHKMNIDPTLHTETYDAHSDQAFA